MAADEFQEALLDHSIKYGTGQKVIKPYVYFCILTVSYTHLDVYKRQGRGHHRHRRI